MPLYDKLPPDIATEESGDVYARFSVRVKEVYSSLDLIKRALREMPESSDSQPRRSDQFKKNAYAVGIVEGWRGDIVYLIATDDQGSISRVAVRDPSFLNWTALSYAAVGNIVPDFPLINKSFNLSYSGNDSVAASAIFFHEQPLVDPTGSIIAISVDLTRSVYFPERQEVIRSSFASLAAVYFSQKS